MTPPLPRDVDEIAVERALYGDRRIVLNRVEMRAAFEHLNDRGYSLRGIAELLGVSPRTVSRWRRGAFPQRRQTYRRTS